MVLITPFYLTLYEYYLLQRHWGQIKDKSSTLWSSSFELPF